MIVIQENLCCLQLNEIDKQSMILNALMISCISCVCLGCIIYYLPFHFNLEDPTDIKFSSQHLTFLSIHNCMIGCFSLIYMLIVQCPNVTVVIHLCCLEIVYLFFDSLRLLCYVSLCHGLDQLFHHSASFIAITSSFVVPIKLTSLCRVCCSVHLSGGLIAVLRLLLRYKNRIKRQRLLIQHVTPPILWLIIGIILLIGRVVIPLWELYDSMLLLLSLTFQSNQRRFMTNSLWIGKSFYVVSQWDIVVQELFLYSYICLIGLNCMYGILCIQRYSHTHKLFTQ